MSGQMWLWYSCGRLLAKALLFLENPKTFSLWRLFFSHVRKCLFSLQVSALCEILCLLTLGYHKKNKLSVCSWRVLNVQITILCMSVLIPVRVSKYLENYTIFAQIIE